MSVKCQKQTLDSCSSGALTTKQASVSSIDQGGWKVSYKYCSIGESPTVT
jgi:hypothetical protein